MFPACISRSLGGLWKKGTREGQWGNRKSQYHGERSGRDVTVTIFRLRRRRKKPKSWTKFQRLRKYPPPLFHGVGSLARVFVGSVGGCVGRPIITPDHSSFGIKKWWEGAKCCFSGEGVWTHRRSAVYHTCPWAGARLG